MYRLTEFKSLVLGLASGMAGSGGVAGGGVGVLRADSVARPGWGLSRLNQSQGCEMWWSVWASVVCAEK